MVGEYTYFLRVVLRVRDKLDDSTRDKKKLWESGEKEKNMDEDDSVGKKKVFLTFCLSLQLNKGMEETSWMKTFFRLPTLFLVIRK